MKVLFLILSLMIITSCGPSAEEIAQQEAALELAKAQEIAKKEQAALELAQAEEKRRSDIATVTCNIMAESRNMDGAMRIREINFGREKIGENYYLGNDEGIKEAFEWGLCKELVLNDPEYITKLDALKKYRQDQILAAQRLEQEKIRLAKEEIERKKKEEERKKKEEEDKLIAAGQFPMFKSRVYYAFSKNMAVTLMNNLMDEGIPAYIEVDNTAIDGDSLQAKNWPKETYYEVYAGPFLQKSDFEFHKDKIIELSGNQYPYLVTGFYDYKAEY